AAFSDDESLIVSPLRNLIGTAGASGRPASITPVFGFTVIQLDVRYMQEQILPALARRFFFARGGGPGGRLGVTQSPNDERRLPPAEPRAPRDEELGRWRLLVQHASGSLEAAVANVRWRNLGLSFGMLLLLSVSVALLAAASRRAHRLAEQQMEFVAGVTHELRTPVAVIRSAAENLSHGVVGNSDRVKRYGAMIESEARRLGEMI